MWSHDYNAGLAGYYADTEYYRKQGGQLKTIFTGRVKDLVIRNDLIQHGRVNSAFEDNLIALEVKKAGRPEPER
jgi:hypothetical protein